ncbi:KH domain containing protein [Nitzschia inconspicua]|uniref:KH domain containing protein n=1 Tax=Nitzschia inconspicua TaxID=303405 RepID=A0A9K3PHH0_9STRA|nr:KH domain containing protein [Nitzschia inconspicua]
MSTIGTTAEEAAAKAKEIASRLMSNATAASNDISSSPPAANNKPPTERKRKRWGSAADIANPTTEALPGLAEVARKKQLQAQQGVASSSPNNSNTNTKRVWVPTSADKPETHFASYLKDRLPELCAKINIDGFNGDEKNKMELGGRGAAKEIIIGMPLEPLHVLILGSDEFIEAAIPKLDELLAEAEKAEREGPLPEPGESSNFLENSTPTDYSTALTLTRPYRSDTLAANASRQSGYKPATVAQLISNNPNVLNPTLGVSPDELLEETINIPNGVVGFIIGRGGETISSLQARSGCKVQIQKEHELQPGQSNRVITLQASSQESIDTCREMIESMVQDRIRAAGGSIGRDESRGGQPVDAKVAEALAAGHALVIMDVPDADVGLIIGKAGATIKSIQDFTQSAIQIPPVGNSDDPSVRTISITAPTREGAEAAKARIENLLQSKPSYASRGPAPNTTGPQLTIEVIIPDKDVGLCIGRQGCVIKEMQNKTGTRIQIPSHPTMGQPHRVATITGTPEGCEHARSLIERIITEQTSGCVMSGPTYNSSNQQDHYQAVAQQNDDPAWQAYYAAQALAQQQQQQQQPSAGGGQATDAYYEQFFRYAYYYGEDAARQYYGSWSPPIGTPNPYGVNPNPSPAPVADAAGGQSGSPSNTGSSQAAQTASAQASAAASASSVRDSSTENLNNVDGGVAHSHDFHANAEAIESVEILLCAASSLWSICYAL